MGIMDIFTRAPAATPAAPVKGAMTEPTALPTPGNPNLPTPNTSAAATAAEPASPLDAHNKLWENDPTKAPAAPVPLFDIDPVKLQEAMKTADFTKLVPAELLAKAQSGDAAAMQAVLNGVTQNAFSHQTMATTKLIEQALAKQEAAMLAKMPELVRQQRISENLADNPLMKHAATRPLIESLQAQLTKQNPTSSPAEIAEQARSFIAAFVTVAQGKTPEAVAAENNADNWEGFAS